MHIFIIRLKSCGIVQTFKTFFWNLKIQYADFNEKLNDSEIL